ncbi:putative toxin-antitoxin system toxin component, PIN family [Methylomonas koyamae]|uniref:putative toxin-antitoxin system toxin component, PIN family n=1 Tax=Methylomonas koyamae TaxID=702114 RepID=UPI00112E9C06|nr:putative toxin-antitoxin system toxin component, PIN family [Methylomonas koyamae]TPQ25628.1 putative toxin-antitoxin system toxin component, PIN family [Methylomonas koyamae]
MTEIIVDTNVLFAGLYSASGASFKVLELLAAKQLSLVISTPLLFEYEEILKRNQTMLQLTDTEIEVILDSLCGFGRHQKVYFLWRPYLPDPKDDLVLELAVAAEVKTIVTHNLKDFVSIEKFGVEAITPKTLLERLL